MFCDHASHLKVSELLQNIKTLKATFCQTTVLLFKESQQKMCFFNENAVFEQNQSLIMCAYMFCQKSIKISSSLTSRHSKKRKICVIIRTFRLNISPKMSLRSIHLGMLSKNNCAQKYPLRCLFQYGCSKLVVKFFEKRFLAFSTGFY